MSGTFTGRDSAVIILFSFVILLAFVEMFFSYFHDRKYYKKKDTWSNVYLMGMAFLMNLATKTTTFFLLEYTYQFRLFTIQNVYLYWFLLIIAEDFLYWALHALGHFSRFFWAIHVTHHSSEHFNLTTGFRSTVFEPLYRMFFYAPLALMGFTAVDILFCYLITQMYGNIVHTQAIKKLHPVIEYIFVTPSHHRVHHASNVRYLDRNMGMMLILWDRWFGTFQAETEEEKVKYGLTKQPEDMGPVNIIFHEFIAISKDIKSVPSLVEKIKYIFFAPGWSHDGSTQTAREMRKSWADKSSS